jgi:hypothetical protein
MPEIKSKKTAARVKIGPADFLKTGVFWQALVMPIAAGRCTLEKPSKL